MYIDVVTELPGGSTPPPPPSEPPVDNSFTVDFSAAGTTVIEIAEGEDIIFDMPASAVATNYTVTEHTNNHESTYQWSLGTNQTRTQETTTIALASTIPTVIVDLASTTV